MVNKIDELKLQLFDLQRNIAETEQRIESISRRKKELEDSGFTDRNLNDELLSLTSTLHALYNDLTVLNDNEELYWALPAVKSNGVVELRVRSFAFNGDTFNSNTSISFFRSFLKIRSKAISEARPHKIDGNAIFKK